MPPRSKNKTKNKTKIPVLPFIRGKVNQGKVRSVGISPKHGSCLEIDLGFGNSQRIDHEDALHFQEGDIVEITGGFHDPGIRRSDAAEEELGTYQISSLDLTDTRGFESVVGLGSVIQRGVVFCFKGLDLPLKDSAEGKKLQKHINGIREQSPYMVLKKYQRNPLMQYVADVFYLPHETDPVKTAREGRFLNQELLDLGLAKVYDARKRKINFKKRTIKMENRDELDLVTGNFKAEVCMYINDCMQYLKAGMEGRSIDMEKGEFDPTDEEFLIIYGLKDLKDICMRMSGDIPMDWKGN